jgi:hypothetical protein
MANFITGIISLSISVVVLANVYISMVKGTQVCMNSTGYVVREGACNGTTGYGSYVPGVAGGAFTAAESAMWGLLTLVGIVGLVYGVMSVFGIL